jgi:hypothetical protein
MAKEPVYGTCRPGLYDGQWLIERYGYYNTSGPKWAVPAWEEWGKGSLAGPFRSKQEAQKAIDDYFG